MGEGEDGPVTGVRVAVNAIEADEHGHLRAVPTGEEELIECGLVLRSIGYRGRPVDTVPFDERRGLIRNEGGRVIGDDGAHATGEYAVGWIKRGPSASSARTRRTRPTPSPRSSRTPRRAPTTRRRSPTPTRSPSGSPSARPTS